MTFILNFEVNRQPNKDISFHFVKKYSQHLICKVEKQVIQTPIFKYATSLFLDQQLSPLFQVVKAKLLPLKTVHLLCISNRKHRVCKRSYLK